MASTALYKKDCLKKTIQLSLQFSPQALYVQKPDMHLVYQSEFGMSDLGEQTFFLIRNFFGVCFFSAAFNIFVTFSLKIINFLVETRIRNHVRGP